MTPRDRESYKAEVEALAERILDSHDDVAPDVLVSACVSVALSLLRVAPREAREAYVLDILTVLVEKFGGDLNIAMVKVEPHPASNARNN